MELHPSPELSAARRRAAEPSPAERYLERLPLRPERRRELLMRAKLAAGGDSTRTLVELHRLLSGELIGDPNPAYGSVQGRIEIAARAATAEARRGLVTRDAHGRARLATTPPLMRKSIAPREWRGGGADTAPVAWHRAGTVRRLLLLTLVVTQTALAAWSMSSVLPYHGGSALEFSVLVLFAILFGWVSAGFWTALMGFFVQLRGDARFSISRSAPDDAPIDVRARTAIVMPICNEDVTRVFAGMRATWESLQRAGVTQHFDCFILSDSSDPDVRVAEAVAWRDLCREVDGFGKVFYRWRQHRIKRKSGNVSDFCRRWGNCYRYMVVLDADSVMTGACLAKLVRLMEANARAGIIQTAPRAAGRDTFFARVQQFATRVYGPLFTAGLHFWQLGESHYWGHNAIIRLAPFMRHCSLARLPGRGSLSGEILSHDFVEAALMRRAGWGVWIAYDVPGSYEEMPPNLVDELKRDRRWCHGNLINSRLMFGEGLHPAHRAVFMTGVLAYLSAPLWFLFLVLSTALLAVHVLVPPTYFVEPNQLFPRWPEWHQDWAVALWAATGTLLFLPKILSTLLAGVKEPKGFGGPFRLALSVLGEMALSALMAPIRMLFHTHFVLSSLLGFQVQWKSPPREDAHTTWGEAFRRHGFHTVIGIAWAALVYWLDPSYLPWLLPVVGALALSIPLSVFTSRATLGRRLRAVGYFAIPEETTPPMELRRVAQLCNAAPASLPGLVDAVTHPLLNALCCGTGIVRPRQPDSVRREREALVERSLRHGISALSPREAHALLGDPLALSKLHFAVWASPHAHESWREATATLRANVIPMPPVEHRPRAGRSRLLTPRVSPPPGGNPRPPASPLH